MQEGLPAEAYFIFTSSSHVPPPPPPSPRPALARPSLDYSLILQLKFFYLANRLI